jgi:hypothetical protein
MFLIVLNETIFIDNQKLNIKRTITSGYKQKASRCAGQVVTIFALYQDSLIVTQNLSSVYQFRKPGSGHPNSYRDPQPRQLYLSPVPIAIGIVSADGATNAFCSDPLAVRFHCQL